jgi:hypothetical protein
MTTPLAKKMKQRISLIENPAIKAFLLYHLNEESNPIKSVARSITPHTPITYLPLI